VSDKVFCRDLNKTCKPLTIPPSTPFSQAPRKCLLLMITFPPAAPDLEDHLERSSLGYTSIEETQPSKASTGNILLSTPTWFGQSRRNHTRENLVVALVSQQLVLYHSLSINNFLPQSKHGWYKARRDVASARGSMIGSRKCRLRVVFHSQPLPPTRGRQPVQKLFVGASFCSGTWRFSLVLPLLDVTLLNSFLHHRSAVYLNLVLCGDI
jgi:hypothetical protein